jgi:hypothetical protein
MFLSIVGVDRAIYRYLVRPVRAGVSEPPNAKFPNSIAHLSGNFVRLHQSNLDGLDLLLFVECWR